MWRGCGGLYKWEAGVLFGTWALGFLCVRHGPRYRSRRARFTDELVEMQRGWRTLLGHEAFTQHSKWKGQSWDANRTSGWALSSRRRASHSPAEESPTKPLFTWSFLLPYCRAPGMGPRMLTVNFLILDSQEASSNMSLSEVQKCKVALLWCSWASAWEEAFDGTTEESLGSCQDTLPSGFFL